jgi:hypothetical protein
MKHLKRFESNEPKVFTLNELYDIFIDIDDNSNYNVIVVAANGMSYSLKEIREGETFNFKRYPQSKFLSFKIEIHFKNYINYSQYIGFLNSYSFVERMESYGWVLNYYNIGVQEGGQDPRYHNDPMEISSIKYTFTFLEE